jgi:hypothetical protein
MIFCPANLNFIYINIVFYYHYTRVVILQSEVLRIRNSLFPLTLLRLQAKLPLFLLTEERAEIQGLNIFFSDYQCFIWIYDV